jgi:mycothiol synthase
MASLDRNAAEAAMLSCSYLEPGEEDLLTRIQNRSFAGTWGYNPNTPETINYRTGLAHFSYEDVVLACRGDNVVGYCWTEVNPAGEGEGRICMIGVDPGCRTRGAGRRLLLAGLARLLGRGVSVTMLTVDSENRPACNLYRSVGFRLREVSLWYEKATAPA